MHSLLRRLPILVVAVFAGAAPARGGGARACAWRPIGATLAFACGGGVGVPGAGTFLPLR